MTNKLRTFIAVLSVSTLGIASIQNYEGFRSTAYKDSGGVPTIGYGSTEGVTMASKIDEKGATRRLITELRGKYHQGINNCIKAPLNQSEYDAYISLAYNIGTGAFCRSTLVRLLNEGKYEEACKQILLFNKAKVPVKEKVIVNGEEKVVTVLKKVPIKGLTNRRQKEYKTCTSN